MGDTLVLLFVFGVLLGIPICAHFVEKKAKSKVQQFEKIKWETIAEHRKAFNNLAEDVMVDLDTIFERKTENIGMLKVSGGSIFSNLCSRNIIPIFERPEETMLYSFAISFYVYFGIEFALESSEEPYKRSKCIETIYLFVKEMFNSTDPFAYFMRDVYLYKKTEEMDAFYRAKAMLLNKIKLRGKV